MKHQRRLASRRKVLQFVSVECRAEASSSGTICCAVHLRESSPCIAPSGSYT